MATEVHPIAYNPSLRKVIPHSCINFNYRELKTFLALGLEWWVMAFHINVYIALPITITYLCPIFNDDLTYFCYRQNQEF